MEYWREGGKSEHPCAERSALGWYRDCLSGRNTNTAGYVYRCDWEILQECDEILNLKDIAGTGTCGMNWPLINVWKGHLLSYFYFSTKNFRSCGASWWEG